MQIYNNTLIKHYRILELLGEGKTSKTFLVEDINTSPSVPLILKQYLPLELTPENQVIIQEKFIKEVNMLNLLGKNTVQIPNIYEYFEENQTFCLVQEWIEGQSLASLIKEQGIIPESKVKEILLMILPVLNYIHSQGVIHGNLKPDNIIFEKSTGLPVLIDFGTVKSTMGLKINAQGQIINSLIIGSNGYRPTEQIAGKSTYNSDLYALGLTAIYLLTGNHPQNLGINQLTGEILWKNKELNLSLHLANILDKAIKPEVKDRYQNDKEMLIELQTKVSKPQKSSYSPYQELFESNMKDKSPLPFSPTAIATTVIALLVVGGLFYNHRVSVGNQKLIEEKQTEISKVENSQQKPILGDDLVKMEPETATNTSPTTEPLPYYPSEVTTPQNTPTPLANQNLPTENPAKSSEKPTQVNPSTNYIDIGWSTKESWAAKMPEKSIALTFDDGPNPEYTPQVLDILKRHNIKATFFLVGKRVEARCDLVRRIVAEGHEIANHTYSHPFLTKVSPAVQQEEMEKNQQAINACVGFSPRWLRTPYGDQSEAILEIAHNVGLNTVLWTIDTEDWNVESTSQKITSAGLQSDGKDIILMHDSTETSVDYAHQFQHPKAAKSRENTVNALEPMIEEFEKQNMRFMTISEAFPDAP